MTTQGHFFAVVMALWCAVTIPAQMPGPPGQVVKGEKPLHEAYLFAHILQGDYWRLYYSVSLDGLHWEILNGGQRVFEEYRGHAAICKGHDGCYYLVGNRGDEAPDINFWVSADLINWMKKRLLRAVSRRGVWSLRCCRPEWPVVSGRRRNPISQLGQILSSAQGASRLDAPDNSETVRRAAGSVQPLNLQFGVLVAGNHRV